MKKTLKKIICGILIYIVFTIIYILSFRINLFNIDIFFYKGIINLILISIILIVFLFALKKFKNIIDIKDIIILVLSFVLINLLFFGMVPVTLERSISVFMLNNIDLNDSMTQEQIQDNFINVYVYENGAFSKRLHEQMATGTLVEETGKYSLSKKGEFLLRVFKGIDAIYNINSKLLKAD